MGHSVRRALDSGDSSELLAQLRNALSAGTSPLELGREGLLHAMDRSGDLRGARWSHAFLTLEAALRLAQSAPLDVAFPATVNALAFLDGSDPTRTRGLGESLADVRGSELAEAVRGGDLPRSESAALALARDSQLEGPWFELATSNLEGWGHRPLVALAVWRLRELLPSEEERLIRGGLRHWIPWELGPPLAAGGPLGPEEARQLDSASSPSELAEAVANLLLQGQGVEAVQRALATSESTQAVADGLLRAACRVFSALPELRQLHGVTVGRAVVEAVLRRGAPADPALILLANFIGEGWSLALKSGRVLPEHSSRRLGSPGPPGEAQLAVGLCQREATPNFGHLIKLVEASQGLGGLMEAEAASGWAAEVLRAASRKATPWRRVWATVSGELPKAAQSLGVCK